MPDATKPPVGGRRIISAVPIDIHLSYNEMTGNVAFTLAQPIPFPVLVVIFCNVLAQLAQGVPEPALGGNPAIKPPVT